MDNSNLIRRAKSGDPAAIAQLINRQLNAKGIEAEVVSDWDGLSITLRGRSRPPDQANAVAYLRSAFQKLQATAVHTIHVKGSHVGATEPVWSDMIVLASPQVESGAEFGDESGDELGTESKQPRPPVRPEPDETGAPPRTTPDSVVPDSVVPNSIGLDSSVLDSGDASDPSASDAAPVSHDYFNPIAFRLSWLALNVPLVWLFHLLPRFLYRYGIDFALTSPLRPWDIYIWVIMIPIAVGQWLLLRRHLAKAYWWAIALLVLFYLEELIGARVLSLLALRRFGTGQWLSLLPNVIRGFTFGLVVGIPQWLLLRRSLGHAAATANWIWISAIAWMCGLGIPIVIVMAMPNLLGTFPGVLYPLFRVVETLAEGIGPLLYALITAIALARWIRMARPLA